jgi:type II secretory pathway pseudopilin PulG
MMRSVAWVMVLATISSGSCTKDNRSTNAAASAVTSPAVEALIESVPGDAYAIAYVDLSVAPWTALAGSAAFLLDPAMQQTLDTDLRRYVARFAGLDVSKLQYAVAFASGQPMSGAVLLTTVAGAPKIPGGAAEHEGAKVWREPGVAITVAMKGDTMVIGQDDAVRGVLDTMAQKRRSAAVENKPLVDWLYDETRGASVALAAIASKDVPLPSEVAGISRLAVSFGRARVRAVVEGDEATISALHGSIDRQIAGSVEQAEGAKAAAQAGNIPPPHGAVAVVVAAYARSFFAMAKPKRDGNRLVSTLDLTAEGAMEKMIVSTIGILAPVAVPTIIDYVKKARNSEARLLLNKLKESMRAHHKRTSMFPVGATPLTPSQSCCEGPSLQCEPTPDAWRQSAWQALDFEIDDPHLFQYSYWSNGYSATAQAIGDLDCDGTTITYLLTGFAVHKHAEITITPPGPNAD